MSTTDEDRRKADELLDFATVADLSVDQFSECLAAALAEARESAGF